MKVASTKRLRKNNWSWYSELVNKCSNPDCNSESKLEVHHIIPLYQGGTDIITNCVVLCSDCHGGLKLHSNWEYYHTVILNWKIKSDNDILNKIPVQYKEQIIDAGFSINNKLIDLIGVNKEREYQKLQLKRQTVKEIEYEKCKMGFNQCCIDYEVYHSLIESQTSSRW